MIVKKLLARFINDKILQTSQKCWIASAAISERGFDLFIKNLSKECAAQIVIGLDLPTDPKLLRRILTEFSNRIKLRIFTENFFHPKVYIFELDKREIAFVGSGNFTKGGLTENEELSYLVSTPEEVEELRVWFRGYFDQSIDLTEEIINEYEKIYPSIISNQSAARKDTHSFINYLTGNFDWDTIDWGQFYFKRSDYMTFEESKARLDTPDIRAERVAVRTKMLDLNDLFDSQLKRLGLNAHWDSNHIVSSIELINHHDHRIRAMWLAYGRSEKEIRRYGAEGRHMDFIRLQVIIRRDELGIWLMPGKSGGSKEDREYFRSQMRNSKYRNEFYQKLISLGTEYWIEVAENIRNVDSFESSDDLWKFTRLDNWEHYYFIIGRNYLPNAPELKEESLQETILKEFKRLLPFYKLMKDKTFE